MSSSTNQIKALAQRFASLPLSVRTEVTKRLLELYSSEQASREAAEARGASRATVSGKSFLEEFWDEVEKAHADRPHAVNPFTAERGSRELRPMTEADSRPVAYMPLIIHPSNLLPLI